MPIVATSSRRQLAMAIMLALAMTGGVIRWQAPNPSTLRDIGSLLLVLWLPAVGNFVGWLMRKIPRSEPPPTGFAEGAPFQPELLVRLERVPLPDDVTAALAGHDGQGTLLAGRHGYTVRMDRPIGQWFAGTATDPLALQCLLPAVALKSLRAGTAVHLLVGRTAVASGEVLGVTTAGHAG